MVAQVVIEVMIAAALFLATAKLHGRQLRLERERAGYATVSFRGGNPPFVTELWRRERWIFWGTAALAAVMLHFCKALFGPVRYVLAPMTIGFIVGGALSWWRQTKNR